MKSLQVGLVGYWPLDTIQEEMTPDGSGHDHAGMIVGNPQPVQGRVGGALAFDGSDDYIHVPAAPDLDVVGPITMAAWIKLAETGPWLSILDRMGGHMENYLRVAGRSEYQGGSWNGGDFRASASWSAEDLGTWVHVAATYDGSQWRIYRNGELRASAVWATGALPATGDWYIGAFNGGSERRFRGAIDEVWLFNRALTDDEVAALAAGAGGGVVPPGASKVVRMPAPDEETRKTNAEEVEKLFGEDARRAGTSEAKEKLADKILAMAKGSDDPGSRYALLDAARKLAMEAGGVEVAEQAMEQLASQFEIDPWPLRAETLEDMLVRMRRGRWNDSARQKLLSSTRTAVREAAAEGEVEVAQRLLKAGTLLAGVSGQRDRAKEFVAASKNLEPMARRYEAVRRAEEVLAKEPNDSKANAEVGQWRCLVAGHWQEGLPCLALAGDAELSPLAKADLEEPTEAQDQVDLAGRWWQAAEKHEGAQRRNLQRRAAYWYRQAMPQLAGLKRKLAEDRIRASEGTQ
jgi:hypothetical protein